MATEQTTNSEDSEKQKPDDKTESESCKTNPVGLKEARHDHFLMKRPYWFLAVLLGIIVAVLAFLVAVYWTPKPDPSQWMEEVQDRAGKGGVDLFKSYDLNRDGYLSIFEFEHLIPHLKNLSSSIEEMMPMEKYLEYSPKEGEEVFVLYTNFTPVQIETMTSEVIGKDTLNELTSWKEPIRKQTVFGASEFRALLPEDMNSIALGKPYPVAAFSKASESLGKMNMFSSSRYYPPVPKDSEAVLFRLLGMMHHHPFVSMRFPPRGTVACVQAFNDHYIHVVFRMHAEFQLNKPPLKPFWFTPAQFVGDLVMTRDGSHVHYFHMRVPNERRLNVDMEWMTVMDEGEEGMEVDIGYLPRMEWIMKQPSSPASATEDAQSAEPPSLSTVQTPDQMEWTSEAPREDVLQLIEVEFFPFKTVTYHNLTRGMELSREQKKPLHAIFLWGALDDQSC